MAFSKVYFVNMILYFLLNVVLFIVFMLVGGVDLSAGLFGTIQSDLGGFFAAIVTPGGTEADIFSSTHVFLQNLYENNSVAIAPYVVGLLWVWVPGCVAAFVAGRFYSWESAKNSFWGTTLSVFTLSLLTLLIVFIPSFVVVSGQPIAEGGLALMYQTSPLAEIYVSTIEQAVMIVFVSFINAMFFGGISAASSNKL